MTLHIAHFFVDTQARLGITEILTLESGAEGDRFQKIKPFADNIYRGPLLSETVKPADIGGTWFPSRPTANSGTPKAIVVLWIHGGAFVTGNGRSAECGALATNLVQLAGVAAVFSVQYRLSGYGDLSPFPAALQDVLTAYLHLRHTCGLPASSIVIAGNSSGANLVLAFLRYLEEMPMPELGRPLCAVAVSPWVVPLQSLAPGYVASRLPNYRTEYVADSFHKWGARTYQPRGGVSDHISPYITLRGRPFGTAVPILATYGQREVLEPAITAWATEMQAVAGNRVEMYCDEDGVHASLFVGEKMGWGKNARKMCTKIGEFIKTSIHARAVEDRAS